MAVTLNERLAVLRREAGMTLAQVASHAELSVSHLSDIEHGRRMPSLEALVRIASAFDLDAIGFLRGVEPFDEAAANSDGG